MIDLSRGHRKIYLFEILMLRKLVILHVMIQSKGLGLHHGVALRNSAFVALGSQVPLFLGGCLLRLAYSAMVGKARTYLRRILTWEWILFSARLLVAGVLTVHVYGWLKGLLQLLRPVLYDEAALGPRPVDLLRLLAHFSEVPSPRYHALLRAAAAAACSTPMRTCRYERGHRDEAEPALR